MRALGRRIGAVAIGDVGHQRLGLLHPGGIIGADLGAQVLERGHQRDRGRLAHVVGVRLEGQAEHRDRLAANRSAQRGGHLARHRTLALVVDRHDGLDDAQRRAVVLRGLDQRNGILGKAGAAVARPGVQEFRADAVVEPDPARDLLDIGADLLAQIRHFVDEGDLGREEAVGRVFDHLRGAAIGEQDRRRVEVERAIKVRKHLPGAARHWCRRRSGPDA